MSLGPAAAWDRARVAVYFALWYLLSVVYSVKNKQAHIALALPLSIATAQLVVGSSLDGAASPHRAQAASPRLFPSRRPRRELLLAERRTRASPRLVARPDVEVLVAHPGVEGGQLHDHGLSRASAGTGSASFSSGVWWVSPYFSSPGSAHWSYNLCTAEMGTLSLEFAQLSDASGDARFVKAVTRVSDHLARAARRSCQHKMEMYKKR